MGSSPQMSRPRVGQKHPSYFLEPEKRGIAYSFPLFYEFQFVLYLNTSSSANPLITSSPHNKQALHRNGQIFDPIGLRRCKRPCLPCGKHI
ncbi:Uncharacterized protein APZ42_024406 [Daphnia magna]|uniref:Uncharacterized protein n=1 Tax=Daphnia magna TaxID=35525 RepID=A0A0P4Y0Q2_9CRUS|nr:Uncharacterized protein APZ42_024406 [Daphnia magna]